MPEKIIMKGALTHTFSSLFSFTSPGPPGTSNDTDPGIPGPPGE